LPTSCFLAQTIFWAEKLEVILSLEDSIIKYIAIGSHHSKIKIAKLWTLSEHWLVV
jgi:hypothetical protein